MRFIFATGGTGGHILPAVAVAEALLERNPDHKILFVGTGRELEKRLLAKFDYRAVDAVPVTGRGIGGLLRVLKQAPQNWRKFSSLFREFQPHAVVGFGGYPSFFPVACAQLRGIPTAIQEQNASLGLANRALCRFSKLIFLGPAAAAPDRFLWGLKRIVRVKNPVRKLFYKGSAPTLETNQLRLLVVGGSQGAMRLNTAVASLVPLWRSLDVSIVHQTGARDKERVERLYKEAEFSNVSVVDFISDIHLAYDSAQLVICRAGALTVAEIEAAGRPAIFVPLPIARAHQAENVRSALQDGWALLVEEGDRFEERLGKEAERLLTSRVLLEDMARQAFLSRERSGTHHDSGTALRPAEVIAAALEEF